jgi:uncharacterized protein GlcG (DUF336 family)
MSNVTLEQASTVIDSALAAGREMGLKPLTFAVLDAGGHLVAMKREDKSSLLRFDIASGKAWGTLGMGISTRAMAGRFETNPNFFSAVAALADGKILSSPGGVLLLDADGDVIGAVGASGDSGDNDEKCVLAGIEAAGLKAGG